MNSTHWIEPYGNKENSRKTPGVRGDDENQNGVKNEHVERKVLELVKTTFLKVWSLVKIFAVAGSVNIKMIILSKLMFIFFIL